MTKQETIYNFFNSFGIPAYPNLADEDAILPYIVYESNVGNAGDQPVGIAVNLFFHTSSESVPNAKAEEISKAISAGGIVLHHDDGTVWVQRGEPWCISINNADSTLKQRQLNVSLLFM